MTYRLTDARVCSLRPCYVARVSATLPLVEEQGWLIMRVPR